MDGLKDKVTVAAAPAAPAGVTVAGPAVGPAAGVAAVGPAVGVAAVAPVAEASGMFRVL